MAEKASESRGPIPFDQAKFDRMLAVGTWLKGAVKHWLGEKRIKQEQEFSQRHYEFGFESYGEHWRVLVFRDSDRPIGR